MYQKEKIRRASCQNILAHGRRWLTYVETSTAPRVRGCQSQIITSGTLSARRFQHRRLRSRTIQFFKFAPSCVLCSATYGNSTPEMELCIYPDDQTQSHPHPLHMSSLARLFTRTPPLFHKGELMVYGALSMLTYTAWGWIPFAALVLRFSADARNKDR